MSQRARAYSFGRGSSSADNRPLVALDVDGVVALDDNPLVPASRHEVTAFGKWRREITVAYNATDRIEALASRYEIAWASAWSYNAHEALREVLELPAEPWAFIPIQFDGIAGVSDYAHGRRWAWITEAMTAPRTTDANGTVIGVDPRLGLTDVDLEALHRT